MFSHTFREGKTTVHLGVGYRIRAAAWTPTLSIKVKRQEKEEGWELRWRLLDVRTVKARYRVDTSSPLSPRIRKEINDYIETGLSCFGFTYMSDKVYIYDYPVCSEDGIVGLTDKLHTQMKSVLRWMRMKSSLGDWGGELRVSVVVEPAMSGCDLGQSIVTNLDIPRVLQTIGLLRGSKSGFERRKFRDVREFQDKWMFIVTFLPHSVAPDFQKKFNEIRKLQRKGVGGVIELKVTYTKEGMM